MLAIILAITGSAANRCGLIEATPRACGSPRYAMVIRSESLRPHGSVINPLPQYTRFCVIRSESLRPHGSEYLRRYARVHPELGSAANRCGLIEARRKKSPSRKRTSDPQRIAAASLKPTE